MVADDGPFLSCRLVSLGCLLHMNEFLCHRVTTACAPEDREKKETNKPGGWGRRRSQTPTVQPGACESQDAPHLKLCAETDV